MTFSPVIRPACLISLAMMASGCSMVESDPQRFQNMAEQVASIPVEGGDFSPRRMMSAQSEGLRPALTVEVLDPHELWDARDGGLRTAIETATVVGDAVESVKDMVPERAVEPPPPLRPALPVSVPVPVRTGKATTIQIGAYSSEASARAAWMRVSRGPAQSALSGFSPTYEAVTVGGKPFVRLKVGPVPVAAAADICRAARIEDPWCLRRD